MTTTPTDYNAVDYPCIAYQDLMEKWELIDDLMGGTESMRDAETTWLPQEPEETAAQYKVRLERAVLYGALKDTITKTASRPFRKPVSIQNGDRLPPLLAVIEDNADDQGHNLTQFAHDVFADGLRYGRSYILIDLPRIEGGITNRDRLTGAAHPYFVHIHGNELIRWSYKTMPDGHRALSMIAYRGNSIRPKGMYGEETVDFVRIYNANGGGETGSWELWEKGPDDKDYARTDEGPYNYDEIQMEPFFISDDPPFEDLAWLNLKHWQMSSDHANHIRFSQFMVWFVKGITSEEMEQKWTIGANSLWRTTSVDADCKGVETTGAASENAERYLEKLEEQMTVLGLQPMLKSSVNVKATGQVIAETRNENNIYAWIRALENVLLNCYTRAASMVAEALPEDFGIDIYDDFGITLRGASDMDHILKAYLGGALPLEEYLREGKRRGVFREDLDIEQAITAIRDEGAQLAMLANPDAEMGRGKLE